MNKTIHTSTAPLPNVLLKFETIMESINAKMKELKEHMKSLHVTDPKITRFHKAEEISEAMLEIDLSMKSTQQKIDDVMDESYMRKYQMYVAKVKICSKTYSNLNIKLSLAIKTLKKQNKESSQDDSLLTLKEDIDQLDTKIKRYEKDLLKLEKKYPWLINAGLKLPNKLEDFRNAYNELVKQFQNSSRRSNQRINQ